MRAEVKALFIRRKRGNTVCPHCGSGELYAHRYYHRNARAIGRDVARKRLRIKMKRYKCRCCGKSFSQSCDRIGKWQRRNARLNNMLSRECANGVSNKAITHISNHHSKARIRMPVP